MLYRFLKYKKEIKPHLTILLIMRFYLIITIIWASINISQYNTNFKHTKIKNKYKPVDLIVFVLYYKNITKKHMKRGETNGAYKNSYAKRFRK